MKRLGLVKDEAHNRGMWRRLTTGTQPTTPQCSVEGVVFYALRSLDDER